MLIISLCYWKKVPTNRNPVLSFHSQSQFALGCCVCAVFTWVFQCEKGFSSLVCMHVRFHIKMEIIYSSKLPHVPTTVIWRSLHYTHEHSCKPQREVETYRRRKFLHSQSNQKKLCFLKKGVSIQKLACAVYMPVCLCVWVCEVSRLYLVLHAHSTSYICVCDCAFEFECVRVCCHL